MFGKFSRRRFAKLAGLSALGIAATVELGPFELRALAVDVRTRSVDDCDLLERQVAR